jgi:methyl coenzyme M reductase alpha subunit
MMPMGTAVAGVKFLRSDGTYLLDMEESFMEGGMGFYASGVLPPDTYTFICYSWVYADSPMDMSNVSASFDVTLDVTPEPATLTLLTLGGLAILRRRRNC